MMQILPVQHNVMRALFHVCRDAGGHVFTVFVVKVVYMYRGSDRGTKALLAGCAVDV